jgi:hypothetical protein
MKLDHANWFTATMVAALLVLTTGGEAFAVSTATLSGGTIVRMDYADDPSTVQGMFHFSVISIDSHQNTVGYLNVVADLDSSLTITSDEWIVRNVPMFLDEGLVVQSPLGVWFDPDPFEPGIGSEYDTWATIESDTIADATGYAVWHSHTGVATGESWCANDPDGQAPEAPQGGTSTSGDGASPLDQLHVPDIAQKWNECGPTSAANSLRWLARKHDFNDKLPANDDDLIKDLMKAMTGSDARPFGGLTGNQLRDGKVAYANDKNLPIVVKGGNTVPPAMGGNAFDWICSELADGEDVEFLILWPSGTRAHWVTAVGCAVIGGRLFLFVNDPADGHTGTVIWELRRDGTFVKPAGTMLWAVSESHDPSVGADPTRWGQIKRMFR